MNERRLDHSISVLLVDDDVGDIELITETMALAKLAVNLEVAQDGYQALEYLRQTESPPDLILLDLNMPRMDGRALLAELKVDEVYRHVPVVVLTTSDADEDVLKTYELGASCFVTKPIGLEEFSKVVTAIEDFWFTVVRLPPG